MAEKQSITKEDAQKVTRVEVIDGNGRSYVKHDVTDLEFHLQDDGMTLKLFLQSDKEVLGTE